MKTGKSILDRKLKSCAFAILDLETTGVHAEGRDRICEIAVARVKHGEVTTIFDTLINPRRKIPSASYDIHKINDQMVEDAPYFDDILHALKQAIGDRIIVAHNASFDMRFLCRALGLEVAPPYFCTLTIERYLQEYNGSLSLDHVAYKNRIARSGDQHSAGSDALLTANLFAIQLERLRRVGIKTVGELFEIASTPNIVKSFDEMFVHQPYEIGKGENLKPRLKGNPHHVDKRQQYATYLVEAIKRKDKKAAVLDVQKNLNLTSEDIRFVHGGVVVTYLDRAMEDGTFHVGEEDQLDKLFSVLVDYGWAPGMKSR